MGKATATGERKFSIIAYIVLVLAYLGLIQILGHVLSRGLDASYAAPTTIEQIVRPMLIPVGLSFVLVYGVITYLRWWKPVLHERKPVKKWLIVLPILMLAAIVLGTNYSGLAHQGFAFTALLLLTTMFVGFAEEGMFRGIGLVTFRKAGLTEFKVALWTTLIFGAAHATNLASEGPRAFVQVLTTIVAGYFFYLIRRRMKGLVAPAILHGLWDFGLISAFVIPGVVHKGTFFFIIADIIMLIAILIGHRHIEPKQTAKATA